MKSIISLFLIHFMLTLNLFGAESFYVMPKDAQTALKNLSDDLKKAQKSIQVAIYSFTHKTLAKSLKTAAKRGVKVTVIFDEESNRPKSYSRLR